MPEHFSSSSPSLLSPSTGFVFFCREDFPKTKVNVPYLLHLFHYTWGWLRRRTIASSCFGPLMTDVLPLCCKSSFNFYMKNCTQWQHESHSESKFTRNQSKHAWCHFSVAIKTYFIQGKWFIFTLLCSRWDV